METLHFDQLFLRYRYEIIHLLRFPFQKFFFLERMEIDPRNTYFCKIFDSLQSTILVRRSDDIVTQHGSFCVRTVQMQMATFLQDGFEVHLVSIQKVKRSISDLFAPPWNIFISRILLSRSTCPSIFPLKIYDNFFLHHSNFERSLRMLKNLRKGS